LANQQLPLAILCVCVCTNLVHAKSFHLISLNYNGYTHITMLPIMHEGHLKSLGTHLLTPSQNFMEVWWQSPFMKHLPWQVMHFLQHSIHFLKTCCRPFAWSFSRIVEQVVLTSWSLQAQSSLFVVSLHHLHRLDGWVVGFLIHFLQAKHRLQLCNTPLRKCLSCSAILKRVLLK
jgi:hypothetical protein